MKEKQWSAWSGTAYKKQYWRKKKTERKIGKTSFRLKAKENLNQSLVENLSTKNRDKTQKNYRNQDMADLYFFFSPVRIFIGLSIEICLVRLGYIDKEAELIRDLYIRIIQITEGDIPNCFLKAVEK